MLFSSIPFLFYFLPCVLLFYYCVPKKLKNAVLLLASLFFYAWGEPKYVLLMIFSIALGYIFGLLIEKNRQTRMGKCWLACSVACSLVLLGWFKYADFFIESANGFFGLSIPLTQTALPIGISFYTFQLISYTADVYRGEAAQHSPVSLATYIALFPQLIAGPIIRYSDIATQLSRREHSFDKTAQGIRRFILGLSKKILIANALGELCDIFRASDDKSVLFCWLYALAFTLHIYFDFSGYSDMAIGLGKLFGFSFAENFQYPYISASITEFWRRWHISLGSWFRDYVYIPLGGSRVSKPRHLLNILIVWLLTGFWHGASWTFIVWGLYFAVLLTAEKLWLNRILKKTKVLGHVYVLLAVIIGFVLFNAADLPEAVSDICAMFGAGSLPLISTEWSYYLRSYAVILLIAAVGATPLPKAAVQKLRQSRAGETVLGIAEPIVLALLLLASAAYLVDGSFNPFLYFRF